MISLKKDVVDLCPSCRETHTAHHPRGRCYACGEKTKTVTRVRINPKEPHEEFMREFQPYFGQLAAEIGVAEARRLEDDFYSEISDQIQKGKKEIVVFLPSVNE